MNLFGGGLIMGGCYMLTDYAFLSRRGRLLYALTAGVITAGIRIWSNYPEGVLSMLYRKHVYGTKRK